MTSTSDDPSQLNVLRSTRRKGDGFPLGEESVVIAIEAEVSSAEALRICDSWESGERYELEISGVYEAGQVRGNVTITELARSRVKIEFELHRPVRAR